MPPLPIKVSGVIGCGAISGIYLATMKMFRAVNVVACADLDLERARGRAAEYRVSRGYSVDELLTDPGIDLVVNLTIPRAHTDVGVPVLEAEKRLYAEKPLAIDRAAGQQMLDLARDKERAPHRQRPRHNPRCGATDLSQIDRRRMDRNTRGRDGIHDEPWPRGLASRSSLLLCRRGRPDVR